MRDAAVHTDIGAWLLIGGIATTLILMGPGAAAPQQSGGAVSGSGEVVAVRQGIMFLDSTPHRVVSLKTRDGILDVAVPAVGATPVLVGEKLLFAGRTMSFNAKALIDPRGGYVYRESDKDMGQLMAEMQAQVQSQVASAAASGEPNAVPTVIVESRQQRDERQAREAEEAQKRRIDLLIAITALLVAIVALEKVPKAFTTGARLLKRIVERTAPLFLRMGRRR